MALSRLSTELTISALTTSMASSQKDLSGGQKETGRFASAPEEGKKQPWAAPHPHKKHIPLSCTPPLHQANR